MNELVLYTGTRFPDGTTGVLVMRNGVERRLCEREDIAKLSSLPLNWGTGHHASATVRSKLALALLLDCYSDENLALREFNNFSREIVALFRFDGWSITASQIREWVRTRGTFASAEEADGHDFEGK